MYRTRRLVEVNARITNFLQKIPRRKMCPLATILKE